MVITVAHQAEAILAGGLQQAPAVVNRGSSNASRTNTRMALASWPSVDAKEKEIISRQEKDWSKRTLTNIMSECQANLETSFKNEKMTYVRKNTPRASFPDSDSPRLDMVAAPFHIQKEAEKARELDDIASHNYEQSRPDPRRPSHGAYDDKQKSWDDMQNDLSVVPRPRRASLSKDSPAKDRSCSSKDSTQGGAWRRSFSKEPRLPSKNSRIPSKCSVSSMFSEDLENPNYMWEKYLKHFTNEQLNWLSEYFEEMGQWEISQSCEEGFVSKEQAAHIAAAWCEEHYSCDNPRPAVNDVNDIILEVAGQNLDYLAFDHLVFFVAKVEGRVLRADTRAGFSETEVLTFKETFVDHCRGESNKNALSTLEIFEVLEDLGYDNFTMDQKNLIRTFIQEVDFDKSGDIDLLEFLQLMRKVYVSQAQMERQNEHEHIRDSKFTDAEIDSYHDLYNHFANDDGTFSQMNLREVIQNLEIDLDVERKKQLDQMVNSVLKKPNRRLKQGDKPQDLLTFGEFLLLFRKMMDVDFADIVTISIETVRKDEDEQRYLSPEEYEAKRRTSLGSQLQENQTRSWVKRMIEKKEDKRTKIAARNSVTIESD